MPTQVIMPRFGETVVDGTVARWLKAEGDRVEKMEPLLDVSTDKIDSEIPSPAGGVILRILVPAGKTVDAGTVLAYIGQPGESVDAPAPVAAKTEPETIAPASPPAPHPVSEKPAGRAFISPVVARIAAEHDVDVNQISGTGMGGRVTKKDILAFVESGGAYMAEVAPRPAAAPSADEILQPLSAMRRAIAAHMVASKRTSPHVTTIFEVDMSAVVRHRAANKAAFAEKGLNLTFTPYFVAAVADALKVVPEANSRFSDDGVILSRRVNVGMAVSVEKMGESKGERGLIVPVIRDADEKNLMGLARAVADLAERARSGRLTPDETQGGTFTITNHGVGGSLIGTPIINQPQSAILGIGAIVKRPIVISSDPLLPSADDAIVIRPMCYLSLSFDHRVLDGAGADAFLAKVKGVLESWKE